MGIILILQCSQNVFVISPLGNRQVLIFSSLQSVQSHATKVNWKLAAQFLTPK